MNITDARDLAHFSNLTNFTYFEDFEVFDLEDGFMVGVYAIICASKFIRPERTFSLPLVLFINFLIISVNKFVYLTTF